MQWIYNWLSSWFAKPRPPQEVQAMPDLFFPKEREIYRYFDGQKVRSADPMRLYQKLKGVSADLEIEFKVARSGMKGADEAYNKAVSRIHGIFDTKPLEEGGITDVEAVNLFGHFWNYSGGVKKKVPPHTTPSTGTSEGTPTNTESAQEKPSPTSPTSDSGSTAAEPTTESPTEPPSVSV